MADNTNDVRIGVKEFSDRVLHTLFADSGVMFQPQFYLTHYCNLACPGCYMRAGPTKAMSCIPSSDIRFYLNEFNKLQDFSGAVVFSGGEAFSLPTQYLEYNIQRALNMDMRVEVKTNGSWVANPARSNDIFGMLARLNVGRGVAASHDDIAKFLSRFSKYRLKMMGYKKIMDLIRQEFPSEPHLSLAVSVDNKIHPSRSADWFVDIADRVTQDARLSKNIALKTFSFIESTNFLLNNVINNPKLGVSDLDDDLLDGWACTYKVRNSRIESYFGDFIDPESKSSPQDAADIVFKRGDYGVVVMFFHPDRTVGFENMRLQSIGRVPYVDERGNRKPLSCLLHDMAERMILDYAKRAGR